MSQDERNAALNEIVGFARIRLAEAGLQTTTHEIIIAPEMKEVPQMSGIQLPWPDYTPTGMYTVTFNFRALKA